jgi:hypothetical protein
VIVRSPVVDLKVASSNVSTTLQVGQRWILFAGGRGVGPAILYWGELVVFAVLALTLGRSGSTPLRTYEWLLLGLGLSTFSWFVLLLVFLWMMAIGWRENLDVQTRRPTEFKILQVAFMILSVAAVFRGSLVVHGPISESTTPCLGVFSVLVVVQNRHARLGSMAGLRADALVAPGLARAECRRLLAAASPSADGFIICDG